jgi:hypothetical protein
LAKAQLNSECGTLARDSVNIKDRDSQTMMLVRKALLSRLLF